MNLPDIDVDEACYERIMSTFSGSDAERRSAYSDLVKNFLIDRIINTEVSALDARMREQRSQEVQSIMASLPERPVVQETVIEAPPVTPGVSPTLGA